MVQDIANADHADEASALFHWNVANIPRPHRRSDICHALMGGARDHGLGHQLRDRQRVQVGLMDRDPIGDIPL
jgi:hypothetical protein